MAALFNTNHEMSKPKGLDGLPKISRRLGGHSSTDLGNSMELFPASGVAFCLSQLIR